MFTRAAVVDRLTMRRLFILSGVILGLLVPASASATITSVFGGTVTCATQSAAGEEGQRWCGNTAGTTVKTYDGITPIDVAVAFPPATGSDNNYPVVGIYPPWGSTKVLPSSSAAQRWLKLGYAVFSESNRGWGSSCGGPSKPANTLKASPCEDGYIHTMARAYEPHDVQYLLGLLAEEGAINPQEIGATGGSNGGGMSMQLGSLDGRVQLTNGELVPWTTKSGIPMKTAAIAPEYPWSDLAQSLQPNGSNLDYVSDAPYNGMLGNHEFGIQKKFWNEELYQAGAILGYYAPTSIDDPEANNTEWYNFANTGGPYNGQALAIQQEEHLPNHGAYYTSLSEPPAPALMENGWNDDLFPVDQTVDYYNRVRSLYPNAALKLFDMDLGHNPRSASTPSTGDLAKLAAAQNAWFEYFVKGQGSEPEGARGGVIAISSHCPATAATSGTEYKAANWASLSPGEINLQGAAEQTIEAPGIAPKTAFTSGTVCTTEAAGENASAATYKLGAAPAGGFTIAGSSTVVGELSTPIKNDQVIARLMDVAENGEQQLVGRAIYRPINPEGGFTKQIFQLHPQLWTVAAGHVLKLQLLISDSGYARNSSSATTSAASIKVRNLELRVPTIQTPGSDGGFVESPRPKYLPPDYTLSRDVTPAAPSAPHLSSGVTPNASGVFTLAWEPTQTATVTTYTLQQKNASGSWTTVATGLTSPEYAFTAGSPEAEGTWTFRVSTSNESPESEFSPASSEVKVDKTAPYAPSAKASREPDYAGGGGWYKGSVEVAFSSNGDPNLSDGSLGSGVNLSRLSPPQTFNTSGSHTACGTDEDYAGNKSAEGCTTVQVDATPPSLEITCPATAQVGEAGVAATFTASDGQSGLASSASGTVPIDTSSAGEKTVSTTAVDNVGNETTDSCTTVVGYPTPGAPALTAGTSPNDSGLFTLGWSGADPMTYFGLSYTLAHHDYDDPTWSNVASGIEALSFEFTGAGEQEGTWEYRVQGVDSGNGQTTAYSPPSAPIVVDRTAPYAPSVKASRAPDYAGGGGWYKNSVEVSFSSNGDPQLSDNSPGSGVNPTSVPASETFDTSGSHTASGTVTDNAGNVSEPGSLTVQVDATPPSLEIKCPEMVAIGSSASATYMASDAYSGLASKASGTIPINTSTSGAKTVSTTAVSNVGFETTKSCTTEVGYYVVVSGPVNGSLIVRAGEAVELTSTAKIRGSVTVKAGGALDVEGATIGGSLTSTGAALLRVCAATVGGSATVKGSSGSVVIGESSGCAPSTISKEVSVKENKAGVSIVGNTLGASVVVTGNSGGTTVTANKVTKSLTVTGNTGSVTDSPNEVKGKSKLQ